MEGKTESKGVIKDFLSQKLGLQQEKVFFCHLRLELQINLAE